MLFRKSHSAVNTLDTRRRSKHLRGRRASSLPINQTRTAEAFYCDVLHGRQVWDAERAGGLSFIVEGTRIDVSTNAAADSEPFVLTVSDPAALAERCWDAGYSVRVGHDGETSPTVSVIDPFGRRIELVG
jgi:hypothetical protein